MLAHKPHERFSSAAELAEALQGLLRPKSRSTGSTGGSAGAPPTNKAASTDVKAVEARTAPPPPPPVIVEVRPDYPRWFAPMARFVERRPRSALAGAILTVAFTFGAGSCAGGMSSSKTVPPNSVVRSCADRGVMGRRLGLPGLSREDLRRAPSRSG